MRHSEGITLCCQTATDDLLRTEPEAFDCATCERRQRIEALDEENREAWLLWTRLGSRFIKDYGLGAWACERAFAGMDPDDVDDRLARLSVIYNTVQPPTTPEH